MNTEQNIKKVFLSTSPSSLAILKNQFRKQSFYSWFKFCNMGKTYLKVEIYEGKFLKRNFIIIEIFSVNSKTKKIRILFTEFDFHAFGIKSDLKEGARKFLIELNRNLLNKIFISRHDFIFKPIINLKSCFFELSYKKDTGLNYWKSINIYSKIVYQTILKFQNKYTICAVIYFMNKKSWAFQIYQPHNGSLLIANLYLEELMNFPSDFWRSFPKHLNPDCNKKSFHKFWEDAERKKQNSNNIIKKIAFKTKFLFKCDMKSLDFIEIYVINFYFEAIIL